MGGVEVAFQNYTCYSSDPVYRLTLVKLKTFDVDQFLQIQNQTGSKLYRLINVNRVAVFTAVHKSDIKI